MGREGSGDVLKLSAGEGSLGASSWGHVAFVKAAWRSRTSGGQRVEGHCQSLCLCYFVQRLAQHSHSPKVVSRS